MVWFWLLACRTDITYEGTLVGNAGSGKGKLAISQGFDCTDPVIPVDHLSYLNDQNETLLVDDVGTTDLFTDGVGLASGEYQLLDLSMAAFSLTCMGPDGEVSWEFPAQVLRFSITSPIESRSYLFELGTVDWLLSDRPEEALQTASTMWLDGNQNGEVDVADSQVGTIETDNDSDYEDDLDDDHDDDHEDTGEEHDTADESDDTADESDDTGE